MKSRIRELELAKKDLFLSIKELTKVHSFNKSSEEDEYFQEVCVSCALLEGFINNILIAYEEEQITSAVERDVVSALEASKNFNREINAYITTIK